MVTSISIYAMVDCRSSIGVPFQSSTCTGCEWDHRCAVLPAFVIAAGITAAPQQYKILHTWHGSTCITQAGTHIKLLTFMHPKSIFTQYFVVCTINNEAQLSKRETVIREY